MATPFVAEPIPGMTVLGIAGRAGSGKSWLANVLGQWGWRPFHFAWHLKGDAQKIGYSFQEAHHTKPPEMREWLQRYGTEENRDVYGDDCWVRVTYGWLRLLKQFYGFGKIVIPDVRFHNEADMIHAMGGKIIQLYHGDREYPLDGTEAADHPSESEMDTYGEIDATLVNDVAMREHKALLHITKQGVRIY